MIVRLSLALLVTLGSIALAWMILGLTGARAAGAIETSTQATPWAVAFDKSSHVWVAEPGCDAEPNCTANPPSYIGEYNRTNNTLVKNFQVPTGFSSPVFLLVDSHGNIWFSEPTTNAIGRLTPSTLKGPAWKQWKVPTASANPYDLVLDNSGNIWFTEYSAGKIGFFNTTTKTFVETAIATSGSLPYGITKSAAGTIWFAESGAQKIGSFTPTTTGTIAITEYVINSAGGPIPHLIVADSAGTLWYSEGFSGDIGSYNPTTKAHQNINVSIGACPSPTPGVTPTPCPTKTHISGIGVDSTGRIWYDDSLTAIVGVYAPTSGALKTLTLSTGAHPYDGLAVDSTNNTWFTEEFASPSGKLGKVPVGTM
jgi:streptogramin lyase